MTLDSVIFHHFVNNSCVFLFCSALYRTERMCILLLFLVLDIYTEQDPEQREIIEFYMAASFFDVKTTSVNIISLYVYGNVENYIKKNNHNKHKHGGRINKVCYAYKLLF